MQAQGVQLPDQVALAGAADRGVAGHVAHRVQVDGKADGPLAHAGGGQGGLDAGVARADHRDIVLSGGKFSHGRFLFCLVWGAAFTVVYHSFAEKESPVSREPRKSNFADGFP